MAKPHEQQSPMEARSVSLVTQVVFCAVWIAACSRAPATRSAPPSPEDLFQVVRSTEFGWVAPPPSPDGVAPDRLDLFLVVVDREALSRTLREDDIRAARDLLSRPGAALRVRPDGGVTTEPAWAGVADGGAPEVLARTMWVAIDEQTSEQLLLTAVVFAPIEVRARIRAARAGDGWRVVTSDVSGGE